MTHDLQPAPAGLSSEAARTRLAAEGRNELPSTRRRPFYKIVLGVLREPMLALLLGGGVVYVLIGEPTDSLVLLGLATLSILITVVQETRTERVLEALRALTSPRALVLRDGRASKIDSAELVREDVVLLAEGDRVPADALVLSADDLEADESLLTGESVAVRKVAADLGAVPETIRPGGDGLPFVYSGSLVVRGRGTVRVTATGERSEIGQIGKSLNAVETEPPRLQTQIRRLVLYFAMIGGGVTLLAVMLYGLLRGAWLDGVLAGLALGMSMLPEEFPVVLTVFMAMGAWRISREKVLTRRAAAIEALGSATVLCTDKTGTLTQNKMTITEVWLKTGRAFTRDGEDGRFADEIGEIIGYGRLASAEDPFDPMERALHELGGQVPPGAPLGDGHTLAQAYGLRPDLLAVTQVWRKPDDFDDILVATKGAPEAVASLCRLDPDEVAALRTIVDGMAARGERVLGVAKARHSGAIDPASPREFSFELLGLVGFADPLRPHVPEAIAQCRSAGIRVAMITGDYPATAAAMARQAGIDAESILSGTEIAELDDTALAEAVRHTSVFARIMPEQKLRIVEAFKANGEIVGMTGDGVNDAPSLKAAHIGVAMGKRGTDVARAAAAIVLLEDDFNAIVTAVRLGRRIYDNLRKAMGFILAVHVPIAGLALLPLLVGSPLLFGPIQIAFLEMIIDPACTLVFEAEQEEKDILNRPPRRPDEPLFSWSLIVWSGLQGFVVLVLTAAVYLYGLWSGIDAERLRGVAFFAVALGIVSLIFVNRSFTSSLRATFATPNTALVWVVVGVTAVIALSVLWQPAHTLMGFGELQMTDAWFILGVPAATLLLLEMIKPLWRRQLGG